MEIRIRGRNLIHKDATGKSWKNAPDADLEGYLVGLALSKKAISAELHQHIRERMQKDGSKP